MLFHSTAIVSAPNGADRRKFFFSIETKWERIKKLEKKVVAETIIKEVTVQDSNTQL